MSFIRKHSGDSTRPIVAVYACPEHGEFDAEVQRDENGEAPDRIRCPLPSKPCGLCPNCRRGQQCSDSWGMCGTPATWTPSPVAARVRRIEAVKGKWDKPERSTFLDTRELAEGMDPEDFAAKRAAIWERKRQEDVMAVKKGFG